MKVNRLLLPVDPLSAAWMWRWWPLRDASIRVGHDSGWVQLFELYAPAPAQSEDLGPATICVSRPRRALTVDPSGVLSQPEPIV